LNGTHHCLVHVGSVNLLGENTHVEKKNTKTLLLASKKIGLEVNHEKPQYIYSCHVNKMEEKYHNIKIRNKIFKSVSKFIYLEKTVTNENLIHEEIKSRLTSGNIRYHSVQNILPFPLLSKNTKSKAYNSLTLHPVLNRCETSSFTMRKAQADGVRKRGVENIMELQWHELTANWRKLHNEELRDF